MPRDFVVRMYTVPTTYHAHPRSTRRYPQYVVPKRIQKSSNAKQQNHVTHATATEQPSDCAHSLSNASLRDRQIPSNTLCPGKAKQTAYYKTALHPKLPAVEAGTAGCDRNHHPPTAQ